MSVGDGLAQDEAGRRVRGARQQVRAGAENSARKTSQGPRKMGTKFVYAACLFALFIVYPRVSILAAKERCRSGKEETEANTNSTGARTQSLSADATQRLPKEQRSHEKGEEKPD